MLKSHYAPTKPLVFSDAAALEALRKGKQRVGTIVFDQPVEGLDKTHQELLSLRRDLGEAAKHLFAAMRKLDNSDIDIIYAIKFPESGLGRAINDRLQRAAAK